MRLAGWDQPGGGPDLSTRRHAVVKTLPELEDLARLVGAEQVLVFTRSPSQKIRMLAGSLGSTASDPPAAVKSMERFAVLERAGCLFALEAVPPLPGSQRPGAQPLAPTREIEHLMARILGRLIVGTEGAIVHQVCESDSRCLALCSPRSLAILQEAEAIASSNRPVLLVGESGVGKELLARFIHDASGRSKLVAISMAQIRGDTAVSELFGHAKGAFTGAMSRRLGAFLEAADGTLFLDEVSDLHPDVAGLLLRAMEERRIKPLGSDQEVPVRARIVAATNQPEKLRHDLFHRFLHRIVIPPLRERREDIRAIAQLVAFREGFGISEKAIRALTYASPWRGNGRELEFLLFHASRRARARIVGSQDVIAELAASWGGSNGDGNWLRGVREGLGLSLRELSESVGIPKSTLEDMEKGRTDGRRSELLERLARCVENHLEAGGPEPGVKRGAKVKEELKRFLAEE